MPPANQNPSTHTTPPTPIHRAAPKGTSKIIAPTTERTALTNTDYAVSPSSSAISRKPPSAPSMALDEFATVACAVSSTTTDPTSDGGSKKKKKPAKSKSKGKKQTLAIDFAVKTGSADEQLYGDYTEDVPPAVDTTKEEAIAGAFDGDGVETRMSGLAIATARHNNGNGTYWSTPKAGITEYVDEFAGLSRQGKD